MTASTATAATAAADSKPAAKRGRPRKEDTAALPPLDLATLNVETGVAMPKQKRQSADNPFVQHVKDSYEMEDARAVTIAEANVSRVESMIRRAADAVTEEFREDQDADWTGVGVSIHKSDPENGNVTITFAAKDRRARKSKDAAAAGEVTAAAE